MSQVPIRDLKQPVPISVQQKRGGEIVHIDMMGTPGKCRSCGADVLWVEMPNGKRPPFDPDGVSHFVTCPDHESWRGKAKPREQTT